MSETPEPSRANATRLSWDEAPLAILAMVSARRVGASPVLVGVTGPVGSGKSSLARRLGGVTVRTDDYLPDYEGLAEHERDLPERADLDLLNQNLASLRAGETATAPVWCFHEHRRTGKRVIESGALVVCEGIHALHERVAEMYDVRVFVEAPRDVRWSRWKAIEESSERGWGVERARTFFETVAEPTFERYAKAYHASAHVHVINDRWDPV